MPEEPTYKELEQQVKSLQSEVLDLREIAAKSDDISEIEKTEMELRESEAYNKVLFQDSQTPLVVMDSATGRFTDCNQAAVSIYAYNSREDVIGKYPLDVSAPHQYDGTSSKEAAQYHIKRAVNFGAHRFEWRHQRPDGSQWDAEVYLMAFTFKKRQMLQFSLQDITERKLTERALTDSKKELVDIIDFLPDPTWVIDSEGKILFWNKAVEDYTGIKKEDMIGKGDYEHAIPFYGERRPTLANLILKRDEKWEKSYLKIKLKESTNKIEVGESYHPILGESGRYLSATASKIYDSEGNVIGAIQSIRDITNQKNAEQEKNRLISELKRAINEVNTLSGMLPICTSCKKVRDDKGYWNQIEAYLQKHSEAQFSHGICPECADTLYGDQDWYIKRKKTKT